MFLSAFATIGASIDQGKLLKGGSAISEENKAVVRRFNELFGECWRTGNADILDEVLAPEFVLLTKEELMGIPPTGNTIRGRSCTSAALQRAESWNAGAKGTIWA